MDSLLMKLASILHLSMVVCILITICFFLYVLHESFYEEESFYKRGSMNKEEFKKILSKAKITNTEAAEVLGVRKETILAWINGREEINIIDAAGIRALIGGE